MKNLTLSGDDRKKIIQNINKIIGQLESVKKDVEENHACLETLYLLMATKGAASRVGQDMLSSGVLKCMDKYSQKDIEKTIALIFKLD